MLEVEIKEGIRLPQTNLSTSMQLIAKRVHDSIAENINRGGRPAWGSTKYGDPVTLRGLRNRGSYTSGYDWAEIRWFNTVHQRGNNNIIPTPAQKKFFWFKYRQSNYLEDKYRLMALAKVLRYNPYPYAKIQPEDWTYMRKVVLDRVLSATESVVPPL